jgi:hypothetical protein
VVIEAGVAAGYLIAWAARKAKRVGGRLDAEADGVIDVSLDRLHEVVAAKLGGHPALAKLVEQAEAAGDAVNVDGLTREQVELALTAEARKDDFFGRQIADLIVRVREAEQATGITVTAGPGSTVFTGKAEAKANGTGIAFAQVAGDVHITHNAADPQKPGRRSQ